MARTQNQLNR